MNKKHLVMLLFSLAFSLMLSVTVSAESSPLENRIIYIFDDSNGLPTGEANTVIQTAEGYVWIGSYGGLIRYDGTSFHNYSENGVFPSSSIRALFQDSSGRLWIGTNDQGVFYCENDGFVQLTHEDNAKFLSVRSFAEGKNGEIYVGATSGLARAESDGTLTQISDEISSTVYNLAADSNGVIWACIDNGLAMLVKDGEIIGSFDSSKRLNASMYCLGGTESGDVLLGTSDNYLYRVKLLDGNYSDDSFELTEYRTGEISTANWVTEDPDGNLWVAAQNGLGYVDGSGEMHTINSEHTASSRTVCFDYEGNVWASSSSYGVIHIVDSLFSNPNSAAGISDTFINTIAIDNDGYYYLGTDSGVIILTDGFQPVTNELTESLEGERIRNINRDSKGNIWIGAYYQNGLMMYEPGSGKITRYSEENGLSSSQIRLTAELSDGSIAVATQNGVSIIENGEVTKTYTKENGLDYPIILSLCEGMDGTLYAGSDGQGIYAIKDGSVTHYGFDEGLPAGVVLRMLLDENGEGLFISAGNSLYYWDFESFRLLDNYAKSPGSVFDLRLQGSELWLMQSNGINILNREKLLSGEETKVRILGSAYGLTGTLNANTWNTEKDGILYLCTSEGISLLDLEQMGEDETAIRGTVNHVTVDERVYSRPESINLDSGATRLTFNFAPLSFSGKTVTVRYRLKGFDEGVTVLTNSEPMSASYTNLSGGDYEFCIEILGSDGETAVSSLTVPVHKDYRLVERTWFWIIVGILVLAVIVLCAEFIIHVKTAHLKKRQNEYRRIIGEALRTFANAIDAKDKYTNGHSLRVATYSLEIAKKLNFTEDDQERIYNIALLHDIGKIGISDRIINKPGKLTEEEIETVKRHPLIGGEILKDFASIPGISEGARYHHERYDGTGYNEGLKGEEIPCFARIICVADSYDTMSGGRHYQQSKDSGWVKDELQRCAGTQFDPEIVKVMIGLIDEGKAPVSFEDTKIRMFYEE